MTFPSFVKEYALLLYLLSGFASSLRGHTSGFYWCSMNLHLVCEEDALRFLWHAFVSVMQWGSFDVQNMLAFWDACVAVNEP